MAIFFDIYISAKTQRENLEKVNACIRSLVPAAHRITSAFFNLVKATSTVRGQGDEISARELFLLVDTDVIGRMNPELEGPNLPSATWREYFAGENISFSDSINKFIEKYASHLDAGTISLCERVANHTVVWQSKCALVDCGSLLVPGPPSYYPVFLISCDSTNGVSNLTGYIREIQSLFNIIERALGSEIMTSVNWSDNLHPMLGSAIQSPDPFTLWGQM
jgi:hypothetical protein